MHMRVRVSAHEAMQRSANARSSSAPSRQRRNAAPSAFPRHMAMARACPRLRPSQLLRAADLHCLNLVRRDRPAPNASATPRMASPRRRQRRNALALARHSQNDTATIQFSTARRRAAATALADEACCAQPWKAIDNSLKSAYACVSVSASLWGSGGGTSLTGGVCVCVSIAADGAGEAPRARARSSHAALSALSRHRASNFRHQSGSGSRHIWSTGL